MYYLENIRLGNIRRFAAEVNVPISRGATIVLAPNGTGKTSLFEAIEFCLSGEVHRLSSSPEALIRDTQTDAFSEMRFTDNLLFRCSKAWGRRTHRTGHYDTLFPGIDHLNLPFLLRLTHILPQRGTDWFVQSNSEEAGSLLDKLPIGRDASRASKNMTKVKKAFTQMVSTAAGELEEVEREVQSWNALLERQRSTRTLLDQNLIPRGEILQRLNTIITRLTSIASAATEDTTLLRAKCAELIEYLGNTIVAYRRKLEILASLENTPKEFNELTARLITTEDSSKTQNYTLIQAKVKLTELQQNVLQETTKLNDAKKALIASRQMVDLSKDIHKAEQVLANAESSLQTTSQWLEQLQVTHLVEQDRQQAELQIRELNRQLTVEMQALLNEAGKITSDRSRIQRWKELELELASLVAEHGRLNLTLPPLKEKLTELEKELIEKQAAHALAITRHDALISASDIIKNAVATIIQHLAADTTTCPVCLAQYSTIELRSKMDQALSTIQPGLDEANKSLSSAKLALEQTTEAKDIAKTEIAKVEKSLAQSTQEMESLRKVLVAVKDNFPAVQTPQEAEKLLEKTETANKKATQAKEEEIAKAQSPISSTDWALLQESLTRIEGEIVEAEAKVRETEYDKIQLQKRINELKQNIAKIPQSEAAHDIEFWEAAIRTFEQSIQTLTGETTIAQQEVDKLQNSLGPLQRQLSEIKSELDRLKGRWKVAGLREDPNTNLFEEAKKETSDSINKGQSDLIVIQELQMELAKWVVADELQHIDQEIIRIKGDATTSDYTNQLNARQNQKRSDLDTITERSNALEQFSRKLKTQLLQLQEYLVVVNDPWKELLNRVVLDPRFTTTTLSTYVKNNKQHAEVTVEVHGAAVAADFVASEAQITDLQLTFLLAMAINNQWTPWRALLLDDPTQHHDLVHASSVFDLLRDYIVDHQFQVLLATHDSVHANFFYRKLLNDGIPVNFIELRATEAGVIAEERIV